MTDQPEMKPIDPGDWCPRDYERRSGELLMEFPHLIVSMLTIGDQMFVTLETGQVIEITELLGEAKH